MASVVVGAGMAGLSAAMRLTEAGHQTTVLEARDRVGGRVLSENLSNAAVVEMGGEWIRTDQIGVSSLAATLDLRIVQTEPWLERDKAMIDTLRSLGIEKGKPFSPDEQTIRVLSGSMAEARAWIDAQMVAGYSNTYNEGTHWALPVFPVFYPEAQNGYTDRDLYSVDARGVTYSFIFFAPKHLGDGQFYFFAIHDEKGNDLEGSGTYRLRVPANAPVNLFWSVVAYDRETHALIRDMPQCTSASNMPDVKQNADGSVDVWFEPEAPKGQESNWIPTKPGGRFELVFRFYGPEPALFDKTWVLPDLELLS
jgi:hypothetical protein